MEATPEKNLIFKYAEYSFILADPESEEHLELFSQTFSYETRKTFGRLDYGVNPDGSKSEEKFSKFLHSDGTVNLEALKPVFKKTLQEYKELFAKRGFSRFLVFQNDKFLGVAGFREMDEIRVTKQISETVILDYDKVGAEDIQFGMRLHPNFISLDPNFIGLDNLSKTVGKVLITWIFKQFPNLERIFITVDTDNLSAMLAITSSGIEEVSKVKFTKEEGYPECLCYLVQRRDIEVEKITEGIDYKNDNILTT